MTTINADYFIEVAKKHQRGKGELEGWTDSKIEISERDLLELSFGLEYACLQIREQREVIDDLKYKLEHSDSIESMTKALELHYKSIVRPINEYCQIFDDWIKICQEAHEKYDSIPEDEKKWMASKPPLYEIKDYLQILRLLDIGKSSYLRRRLYGREPHRTEECPVHKGRWSGLVWNQEPEPGCLCQYNGEITGWIMPK